MSLNIDCWEPFSINLSGTGFYYSKIYELVRE